VPSHPSRQRRQFLIAGVFSFIATAIFWGPVLSATWTLNPASVVTTVVPGCRSTGPQLDCVAPQSPQFSYIDPGGPGWAEAPVDYFYHFNPSSGAGPGLPSWNPYAGSGYPVLFDGHNGHASPTRWITRHWPDDTGRDIVIFLRVLFWTLGVSLCLVLLEAPLALIAVGAIAACFAPHLSLRLDHVMLDVDLLAPWFPFIVLALVRGTMSWGVAAVCSVALGVLVGSLSFLQAQFVLLFACGLVAIAAVGETRGRSLALAGLVGVGFVALYPTWLPLVKHIGDFVSSRSERACIAGLDHTGIKAMATEALGWRYQQYSTGSLIGLIVILFTARRSLVRFVVYALAMILVFVVVGFPSAICDLPGISGVNFGRHLAPHLQFFYLVACVSGIALVVTRIAGEPPVVRKWASLGIVTIVAITFQPDLPWKLSLLGALIVSIEPTFAVSLSPRTRSAILATGLALAVLSPFALQTPYFSLWLHREYPAQVAPLPLDLDPGTPLGQVQRLSRTENRRHFSAYFLHPNWSSAFQILDVRLLEALYPKAYFALNGGDGLFPYWERDFAHAIRPDRFVRPVQPALLFGEEFQRLLIVNRVSLFSFDVGTSTHLASDAESPYAASRCQFLARSVNIESYVCREIGGIAYFPKAVSQVASDAEALNILRRKPLRELIDFATVERLEPRRQPTSSPAAGTILSSSIVPDRMAFDLEVTRAGHFVVADTWFPGWHAEVNGRSVPVDRANVAFKAVEVPAGRVSVVFLFNP
jgi:hypothetical protein